MSNALLPSMNNITFAELLEKAVTEPGMISQAYSAFHNYSFGNQLLAYCQCLEREIPIGPIATFMGWKEKGRYVKKGEKAITLCMPVTCKRTEKSDDGIEETVGFTRFVYRPNWFVLSQTDGQALESQAVPTWDRTRALTALDVAEIPFEIPNGNVQGYARQRSIAVNPVAALPHKTTFHELAHVLLGHTAEGEQSDDDTTPRSLREVEAESVAMLCCSALGLPGVEFSRGYIQNWWQSSEAIPEKSAQKIMKVADQIIRAGHKSAQEGR